MKRELMRFMGNAELPAFLADMELENHTDWSKTSKGTESRGFCFFDLSEPPEERLKYVPGVVDNSFVAVFEVADDVKLRESTAWYAVPGHSGDFVFPPPMQQKREYSIERYSSQTFTIRRFGIPGLMGVSEDGEMKFDIYWLWEDSEMPLSEWLRTLDKESAEETAKKICSWMRGEGR